MNKMYLMPDPPEDDDNDEIIIDGDRDGVPPRE